MRKALFALVFGSLSFGCAITDYPLIYDSRGADGDAVVIPRYEAAYIVPEAEFVGVYDDGSRGILNLVSQDWTGDQWIKSYENYDPTATVLFLDQLYCDPTFDSDLCPTTTAWNPNLPNAYPHGGTGQYDEYDNPFDYELGGACAGLSYASVLVSYSTRIGECGSGVWADKQAAFYEFSLLDRVFFRGQPMYLLPIDNTTATILLNGTALPIYGRFNAYLTERMQLALPVTPNARHQLDAVDRIVQRDGHDLNVHVTYGSLTASYKVRVTSIEGVRSRL